MLHSIFPTLPLLTSLPHFDECDTAPNGSGPLLCLLIFSSCWEWIVGSRLRDGKREGEGEYLSLLLLFKFDLV